MKITIRKIRAAAKSKFQTAQFETTNDKKLVMKDGSDYQTVFEESGTYVVLKRGSIDYAGKFEIKNNELKFKS